ncbi:hypothetical protein pb186bvf_003179 [Paramecium bursaria]
MNILSFKFKNQLDLYISEGKVNYSSTQLIQYQEQYPQGDHQQPKNHDGNKPNDCVKADGSNYRLHKQQRIAQQINLQLKRFIYKKAGKMFESDNLDPKLRMSNFSRVQQILFMRLYKYSNKPTQMYQN